MSNRPAPSVQTTLLGAALLGAALLGAALLVVPASLAVWLSILRLNPEVAGLDRVVLGLWVSAYHVLLALPPLLAVLVLMRRRPSTGHVRSLTITAAAIGGSWAGLNLILRFPSIYGPLNGRHQAFLTWPGLLGAAVSLVLPFALVVLLRRTERRVAGAFTLMAVLATTVALLHWEELDPPVDPAVISNVGPFEDPAEGRPDAMVVIAVDGLSWDVLSAMDGSTPNLDRLWQRAAVGTMNPLLPSRSPAIWNSIATGRTPEEHGVHLFSTLKPAGMKESIQRGPSLNFMNWWNGFNRFLTFAAAHGAVEQHGVRSHARQAPTLWEIADLYGRPASQIAWWNTLPVSVPAAGGLRLKDLSLRPGTFAPAAIASQLPRWSGTLDDAKSDLSPNAVQLSRAQDELFVDLARRRLTEHPESWTFLYLRSVDTAQHLAWRGDRLLPSRHELHLTDTVRSTYAWLDRQIGRLLAEVDLSQTLVLVISDHGFRFDGQQHHRRPSGVFAVAGPGVVPGPLARPVEVLDIAPTVLRLFGLPVAAQLRGRVLEDAFLPSTLPEPTFIEAYDWTPRRVSTESSPAADEEELRSLKAVGYVN